jgi:hypothetical protein
MNDDNFLDESYLIDELYRGIKSEYTDSLGKATWRAFYSRKTDGLSVFLKSKIKPQIVLNILGSEYNSVYAIAVLYILQGIKKEKAEFKNANLIIILNESPEKPGHCLIKGNITEGMAKAFLRNSYFVLKR